MKEKCKKNGFVDLYQCDAELSDNGTDPQDTENDQLLERDYCAHQCRNCCDSCQSCHGGCQACQRCCNDGWHVEP